MSCADNMYSDCSACTGGYAAAVMYTCSDCSANRGLVFGVVVLVIAVLLLFTVIFYLTKKELGVGANRTTADRGAASGTLHRLKHLLPLHAVKIIVVVWQILTQVCTGYHGLVIEKYPRNIVEMCRASMRPREYFLMSCYEFVDAREGKDHSPKAATQVVVALPHYRRRLVSFRDMYVREKEGQRGE